MAKLKKLFFVYACDDVLGEAQAVFDAEGKLLGSWSCNDGNWRNEYFCGFMRALGFETVMRDPTEKELKLMRESFGL